MKKCQQNMKKDLANTSYPRENRKREQYRSQGKVSFKVLK